MKDVDTYGLPENVKNLEYVPSVRVHIGTELERWWEKNNMSDDTSYNAFAKKIIEKDRELRQRMEAAHGESEEMYKLFKERLDIYTAAEKMPTDPITRVLFDSMKGDVVNEIALFKLRKDFDEQASQIITRLDNVENEIRTINDKLNINHK